jgi:hypothetical protein
MRVSRFLAVAVAASAALRWQVGAQQPVPQYRIQPLTDLTGARPVRRLTEAHDNGTVAHDRSPGR